ncbi:MAG: galactose/methyl galactoside ABC transporter permease MglC [Clostridia bacterium]|nr:galactose/methyl galactoside ABC transporter permease MglC [Clostridia bacterium]
MNREKTSISEALINYSLYIVLGVMILAVIITEPSFISAKNITNILSQASTRGILALGVAGLIVLQGTDLSAGRILGLTAIVSASLLQSVTYSSRMYQDLPQLPLIVPFLVAITIGGIFGAINGFGVAKLKLHAFIISLGTQLIAYGISCIYIDRPPLGAQPVANLDERYTNFVNGSFKIGGFEFPYLILYLLIVAVIMWFIWNKTVLGKNMFAIGGNPEAAAVSGVNLFKNIMVIFIISGILYGTAGFLEAGRIGSTTSNTGINYELDAISACVVGGVSFSGGIGTIPGVLIGTIILQFINYGLNYVGISPYFQYIIKGLIIILAVSIDTRKYLDKK